MSGCWRPYSATSVCCSKSFSADRLKRADDMPINEKDQWLTPSGNYEFNVRSTAPRARNVIAWAIGPGRRRIMRLSTERAKLEFNIAGCTIFLVNCYCALSALSDPTGSAYPGRCPG